MVLVRHDVVTEPRFICDRTGSFLLKKAHYPSADIKTQLKARATL